ncbi:MAG: hypothetical protein ACRELX_02930 [Longimicrobiales bacterium]
MAAFFLLASSVLTNACADSVPLERRVERQLLLRQKEALVRELERSDDADHATAAIVVVPANLVHRLLAVAMPVQATIDGRFRITADSAAVDFRGGLALVRLAARAAWAGREDVSARVDVVGALQILDLEETSGTLAARVEILGFETREVRVGGLAPPAERLLNELAERPAGELNTLLDRIEIPVRLARAVTLPRVEEDEITIAGTAFPLRLRLHDVRVGHDRLFVYIDVATAEDPAVVPDSASQTRTAGRSSRLTAPGTMPDPSSAPGRQ